MRDVLVVEDHDSSREWWERHISDVFPGATVFGASTIADGQALIAQKRFTLAILDINLPDGSGIDLLKLIAQTSPETYTVICSIYDDDRHIFAALRAGAMGYLLKDQPRRKQLQQLKEIIHGQPPLSPGVARRILAYFSTDRKLSQALPQTASEPSPARGLQLSSRECEVLTLIAKGYTRPEVAEFLDITLNTVSGYTKSIYQKLNISNRSEAVVEAVKLGLIDRDVE